jgi:hypothetical protein
MYIYIPTSYISSKLIALKISTGSSIYPLLRGSGWASELAMFIVLKEAMSCWVPNAHISDPVWGIRYKVEKRCGALLASVYPWRIA